MVCYFYFVALDGLRIVQRARHVLKEFAQTVCLIFLTLALCAHQWKWICLYFDYSTDHVPDFTLVCIGSDTQHKLLPTSLSRFSSLTLAFRLHVFFKLVGFSAVGKSCNNLQALFCFLHMFRQSLFYHSARCFPDCAFDCGTHFVAVSIRKAVK